MKIKQTLLGLSIAGALLASQMVSAHSSIVEKEIIEGQRAYLTIQVPHGCHGNPTKKISINMPNTQDDLDSEWAFTSVQPVLSWYKIKTETDKMSEQVNAINISGITLPSAYVLKAEFRGRAPVLPHGVESQKLYFDIIQYCTDNTVSEWTVENGKAASVTVVKAPEGHDGHH